MHIGQQMSPGPDFPEVSVAAIEDLVVSVPVAPQGIHRAFVRHEDILPVQRSRLEVRSPRREVPEPRPDEVPVVREDVGTRLCWCAVTEG